MKKSKPFVTSTYLVLSSEQTTLHYFYSKWLLDYNKKSVTVKSRTVAYMTLRIHSFLRFHFNL